MTQLRYLIRPDILDFLDLVSNFKALEPVNIWLPMGAIGEASIPIVYHSFLSVEASKPPPVALILFYLADVYGRWNTTPRA